ncbi:MAG: glycoside hydrolase family 75 protein [Chthoniobacterales bacterium]
MRSFRLRTLRVIFLLLLLGVLAAIILRWVSLERWRWSQLQTDGVPFFRVTPTPVPTPARPPVSGGKLETARLFSGITVNSTVEPTPGGAASVERADPQSYVLELKLRVHVPAPNKSIEELAQVSPDLPHLLPGLGSMITADSVSPYFAEFYQTKLRRLRANLTRLDQLLSRHNFYDCQTVLRLQHPDTKRKAVLIQADMDVDSDGSDADRLPAGSGVSSNFQPFTSYRWPKKTESPNPYLSVFEEKIKNWETEAAAKTTSSARKAELKGAIADARRGIADMKKYSYLIGASDPFIVVPGGFTKSEDVKIGDIVVVAYGDTLYPALVGDVGPGDKTGEASLRIAKELSSRASPMNRPVDDLKVSYIIFPGTAETPFTSPDLDKINARADALVKEIGGSSVPLHQWVSNLPTPTPTPTPTPPPTPTPTASASPSPGESPSASPAPTFAFPLPSPSPSDSPSASPDVTPTPKPSPSPRKRHAS